MAVSASRPAHVRPLFGIAPGGACRASSVARPAVGSYPTVSPSPSMLSSFFSVALSLGLPQPGVTRHPCLMESGLSSHILQYTRSSSHPRPRRLRLLAVCVNSKATGKIMSKGRVLARQEPSDMGAEAKTKSSKDLRVSAFTITKGAGCRGK